MIIKVGFTADWTIRLESRADLMYWFASGLMRGHCSFAGDMPTFGVTERLRLPSQALVSAASVLVRYETVWRPIEPANIYMTPETPCLARIHKALQFTYSIPSANQAPISPQLRHLALLGQPTSLQRIRRYRWRIPPKNSASPPSKQLRTQRRFPSSLGTRTTCKAGIGL